MPRPFTFDEHAARTQFSDTQMLDNLRAFAALKGGRPFSMKEFWEWPRQVCRPHTIMRRFKGWRRALTAAGIQGARRGRYTRVELMDILEQTWREVERPPGHRVLRAVGRISAFPYRREWGSLKNACRKLARFHRGEITRKELVAYDDRGRRQRGRPPLSARTRWRVLDRDAHRCRACGRSGADFGVRLEVDHVIPISKGGSNEIGNLRTLCRRCNRGKGNLQGAS